MPDAMAIAASGSPAAASLSQAASSAAGSSAPAPQIPAPAQLSGSGFILAYNPNAPFANLQDLVAVPDANSGTTGALQTANGTPANPVVYRIASHLYRSLLNQ
ncbi:MAG: hypothetical protein V4559_00985 [Pseudomonadota bacterium]